MNKLTLTILITAFNEEKNAQELVKSLSELTALLPHLKVEFFLIDNGSSDRTFEALSENMCQRFHTQLFTIGRVDINQGYGGGIKFGLQRLSQKVICILPADGKYETAQVATLIEEYFRQSNKQGLMIAGNRKFRNDPKTVQILSKLYSLLVRIKFRVEITDVNGLPKVFFNDLNESEINSLPNNQCLDAFLCLTWKIKGGSFLEKNLRFRQQLDGTASWHGKRMKTSFLMFRTIVLWKPSHSKKVG
jgi:glycosyltransferase involved in cell wall biosynthesis